VLTFASVARDIAFDITHRYRLPLKADDYVELTIDHRDVDVGVALIAPDGRRVIDIGYRRPQTITVAAIAQSSGTHIVEIRSLDEASAAGRYVVALKQLRRAEPQDAIRARAWHVFDDAEATRAKWHADSVPLLLDQYRAALNEWKRAGDRRGQALAGIQIGETYHATGQFEEGLRALTDALRAAAGVDSELECAALNAVARIQLELVGPGEARARADRAHDVAIRTRNRRCEAEALNVLGDTALLGGRVRESTAIFHDALSISTEVGDRRGRARALLNIGYSHADLGSVEDARRSYESALSLWRSVEDHRGEAETLTGLGQLLGMIGEDQTALSRYDQARALFDQLGDRVGLASVLGSIGVRRSRTGDLAGAVDYIAKAVNLFKDLKHQNGEAAARLNLAMCLAGLGRHTEALEHNLQALEISRAVTDARLEARALEAMAQTYAALGRKDAAMTYYQQSLSLAKKVNDPRGQVYALDGLGRLLHESGNYKDALVHLETALRVSRQSNARFAESLILYDLARAEVALGNFDRALQHSQNSLELVEDLRTAVASLDLRASFLASARDRHELQIDLLMQSHDGRPDGTRIAAAFEASERARARSFLDALAQARSGILEGVDPALLEREASARRALNMAAQRITRVPNDAGHAKELAALSAEVDKAVAAYKEIETQVRATSPRYASLVRPQPLTISETQRLLDERTVLLEYFLGKNRSYVWAVTRSGVTGYVLPSASEIERRVRPYREVLTMTASSEALGGGPSNRRSVGGLGLSRDAPQVDRMARDVSDLLLGPVAWKLMGARVVVVADGILANLPFAALPEPKSGPRASAAVAMIATREIVNLPSAATLALLRTDWNQRREWQKAAMVFADPVYEPDDIRLGAARRTPSTSPASARTDTVAAGVHIPRLIRTRREARDIAALASPADLAIDFNASRENVSSVNLAKYKIVHFAAHGLVDDRHPELSGIVLSLFDRKGQPQDGFLRLHDIYNLNIPADLVVLSACSTAVGKQVVGEGLISLVRGFMYAGARRVVASLWEVDDEATSELMARFYRGMFEKKLTPPAALRAAQIDLMTTTRWKAPFYWAGFVLQGDWN
jgi:CHAT domain-containing protein/tetratricopeptide (TPR) repeat protein